MSKEKAKSTKKPVTKKTTKKTDKVKPVAAKEQRPFFRKAIEKKKGVWQFTFWFSRDVLRYNPGWKMAGIGLIKITKFPPEGEILTRKYYKGFLLRWRYWLPIERGH